MMRAAADSGAGLHVSFRKARFLFPAIHKQAGLVIDHCKYRIVRYQAPRETIVGAHRTPPLSFELGRVCPASLYANSLVSGAPVSKYFLPNASYV